VKHLNCHVEARVVLRGNEVVPHRERSLPLSSEVVGDMTLYYVVVRGSWRSEEMYRLRLSSTTFLRLFDPEPFTSRHDATIHCITAV
jgi:hypothetical protein